ncbi:Ufd4 [Symbiodinium pilosum]|uniref:Ufd4 protein n=1 Tax=Symbiodinium pilosum TaxID=2952 RepID=A0A812W164_SYMPI|nr:Ufd4 [Symbiodinium pilosum]
MHQLIYVDSVVFFAQGLHRRRCIVPGPFGVAGYAQPCFPPTACDLALPAFEAMKRKNEDDTNWHSWENMQSDWDDVMLKFGTGGSRAACSVLLRMSSPVFNSMLSSGMREAQNRTIQVEVATKEDFEIFYNLLRPGAFRADKVTQHNVEALLTISEYYQVGFLKHACEDQLLRLPATPDRLLQAENMGLKRQYARCARALAKQCMQEDLEQLRAASPTALMAVATAMRKLLQEDEPESRILKAATLDVRVRRGPDWKWHNQDEEGLGMTVDGTDRAPGWVIVEWDHGLRAKYRVGAEGKYDLRLVGRVTSVLVQGAGGVGDSCNGRYHIEGCFNGKPKFKKQGGSAIMYYAGRWKINHQDSTTGWYYCYPDCDVPTPPTGHWSTQGYSNGDADPAPTVQLPVQDETTTADAS